MTEQAEGRDDAFVSYSREDAEFVRRLQEALAGHGKRLWVDFEDIPPTADWRAKVHGGIEQAKSFVFVLSPDSVASKVCTEELESALGLKKRLVPLVYRDVDSGTLRAELKAPNWISFEDESGFDASVETLVQALETDLEWVDAHARYSVLAGDWVRRDHDASLLLRGDDLRRAEAWLAASAAHAEAATEAQVAFILAGRRAAGRRRRVLFGAVLATLGVSIALGILALLQRNDAVAREKLARSQALATAAAGQLDVDPELSILLAREAVKARASPTAVVSLRRSLAASKVRLRLAGGGALASAAFSTDGQRIVTATDDEPFRAIVWEATTGKRLASVEERRKDLGLGFSSAVSPSGRELVVWSGRTARLWSLVTGRRIAVLRGSGSGDMFRAAFSADGKRVATGGAGAVARVWSSEGKLLATLGHPPAAAYETVAFSPDGRLVAGSADNRIWVWKVSGGKPLMTAVVDYRQITTAVFSPDGRFLAAESVDPDGDKVVARIRLWRTRDWHLLAVLPVGNSVSGLAFSPGGRSLATTGPGESPHIWSVPGGKPVATLQGHTGPVNSVAFGPNGKLLATASDDGTARLWDLSTSRAVAVLRGHTGPVRDAVVSPDGRRVVTAGADGTARVWQVEEAGPLLRGMPLAFSADGTLALTGAPFERRAYLWEAASGRLRAVLTAPENVPVAGAFSPDGSLVATGSGHFGSTLSVSGKPEVRLWRTTDGRRVARLPAAESVHSVAFSPDGKLVLAGEDDLAELWRPQQPRPVRVLRAAKPQTTLALDARFSADGARVLTSGYDHGIALWETSTGRRLSFMAGSAETEDASLDASASVVVGTAPGGWARLWRAASGKVERVLVQTDAQNAAFSPDGALVAVASGDGTGRVWRTSDGGVVAVLSGHGGPVVGVPFSPDGRLVLTSGEDGTSRLWDALTGQSVAVYDVRNAGFTPTGALVETPGVGSTRLAPCDSCGSVDDLLALASRRITRALTCEERRTFLGRAC